MTLKKFPINLIEYLIKSLPINFAASLEWRIQRAQGKGIGFASVAKEVATLKYFCDKYQISDGVIFDVGANVGQYGSELKDKLPNFEVFSFEPSKKAFSELEVAVNKYKNWFCFNFGLGERDEILELFSDVEGSASSTLLNQVQVYGRASAVTPELVQIRSLDSFLQDNPIIKPNILKLDVEGFELSCLYGAKKSLKGISIVQFEFGEINIDSRTYFRDFWNFFKDSGFDLFRVTRGAPLEIYSYSEGLETFAVTNYLALNRTLLNI